MNKFKMENYGQTEVRKCSFCEKTYNIKKFYSVNRTPDEDINNLFISINRPRGGIFSGWGFSGSSKSKRIPATVDQGICLKCILTGLTVIYKNDQDKIKEVLEQFNKEQIVNSLK